MKYLTSLFLVLIFAVAAFAQQPNMVTVDVNQLTPEARSQIELAQTKEKIAQYGSWVGVGSEVGSAIDAGLTAVAKHADNIADTKLGMFAMVIIAYKVIGTDLVQLVVGLGLATLWIPAFFLVLWKKAIPRKYCSDVFYDKDSDKVARKCYRETDGAGDELILYPIVFCVMSALNCAVIFA